MNGLLRFTEAFVNTRPFFTGAPLNNLVPSIFPIAIDGRPYLIDQKSNQFARGFEARVRDSVDQSTSPGEAAINPQGLWRRGETSWHLGAGQLYADTAEAQDYRFYSSKGINPWTKGQLKLLNKVKESLNSSNTNLHLHVADGKLYVADGSSVKYSSNPFAATPTWTTVSGLPAAVPRDMSTDGSNIYLTYAGLSSGFGLWKIDDTQTASNVAYGHEFHSVDFVKGYIMVSGDSASGPADNLYYSPSGNVTGSDYDHPLSSWVWTSFGAGQNAIYVAGHSGDKGAIYKITISSAGVLDTPVVALEFPIGEIPYTLYGYLGNMFIGTSKGVRYATSDNESNLVSGSLIPTPSSVTSFTADDKYVWFNWSNYDGASTGLGRIDLTSFTSTNTPAFAADLMHTSGSSVLHVVTYDNKRVFSVSGDGVYVEDTDNLVETGEIVTGTYRWGIPDRKFVAKFDIRSTPLHGSVTPYVSLDSSDYVSMPAHSQQSSTEKVSNGPQLKFIEAKFKLEMTRASSTSGPTVTRWMARAYASPARSQVFRVPILMHHVIQDSRGKDHYFDVESELQALRNLVTNPVVVNYQENTDTFSVVVEDLEFQIVDGYYQNWDLEGTCIVTMRSVQD